MDSEAFDILARVRENPFGPFDHAGQDGDGGEPSRPYRGAAWVRRCRPLGARARVRRCRLAGCGRRGAGDARHVVLSRCRRLQSVQRYDAAGAYQGQSAGRADPYLECGMFERAGSLFACHVDGARAAARRATGRNSRQRHQSCDDRAGLRRDLFRIGSATRAAHRHAGTLFSEGARFPEGIRWMARSAVLAPEGAVQGFQSAPAFSANSGPSTPSSAATC